MSTGETYSTVYDYLPRTAENLELLNPPIPEGFTQADPGALDPEFDSCS